MNINNVIRLVDAYYPNEYELAEKYHWCDEVSSMLTIEDRQCYNEKTIPVARDGTILLPYGVSVDYVDKIIYKNKVLKKQDARTFGKRTINIKGVLAGVENIDEGPSHGECVTLVYLVPYEPIRLVKYNGAIEIDKDNNYIYISNCEFIPGDTLVLKNGDDVISGISLLSIDYSSDKENNYKLTCGGDSLKDIIETEFDGTITRYVTDSTVCDAPFDSMYIDYLLAKINMYQHDMNSYNQHIGAFNSRLASYKKWIAERCAKDEGKLINWW